ncbi:MAG: Rieske 2Fe-2S domain-containing protein [Deltaproteobacteria bacterium]|nr:Rieske 2Fe-2S domain-containing protein [Deltaproteobacteria bacterium]
MKTSQTANGESFRWPQPETARVPYQVFVDPAIYTREQEQIFRGPVWNYVALDAELPNPGDFKATFIGDTPIVVTRDREGELHAFVNRCAHRGALVCREMRGNRNTHVCAYHQWSYDLRGQLIGVPFRRGIEGKGGYPADFDPTTISLSQLRVATYNGVVFASFAQEVEPIEDYLGPTQQPWFTRVFNRPVRVLGYGRQFIRANWKLYAENTRDPYHASLLHLFHTTFGIYRSSQGGGVIMDDTGRHSMIRAFKRTEIAERAAYETTALRTYQKGYTLADPSLLQSRKEFEVELTNSIHSIFPCLVIQQIFHTLATRHILPKGPDSFELLFTFFCYADDDEDMLQKRIKQANLVGPAGYISMEDGYAAEIVQQAIVRDQDACSFLELGGVEASNVEDLVNEAAVRGFWQYYRHIMDF